MKPNSTESVLNMEDFQSAIKKVFQHFNQLSEKTINPLLCGVFLLGVASTFFEPGMVAYLTMIFGASSGIAYAVAKNQTAKNLPSWIFPAVGVSSALIYAFAGIPGIILGAGLSGGWYLNSNFQHKFQQWKTDFQEFTETFKTNPVSQSMHLTFRALQFLSDLIISIEPLPVEVQEPEKQQEPTVMFVDLEKKLEEPAIQVQAPITEQIMPEIPQQPTPVLFSQPDAKPSAPVTTAPKIIKPQKDTFSVFGQPVLELARKQVEIDNSWMGMGKAFLYSLDPRVDLVTEGNKGNRAGMR